MTLGELIQKNKLDEDVNIAKDYIEGNMFVGSRRVNDLINSCVNLNEEVKVNINKASTILGLLESRQRKKDYISDTYKKLTAREVFAFTEDAMYEFEHLTEDKKREYKNAVKAMSTLLFEAQALAEEIDEYVGDLNFIDTDTEDVFKEDFDKLAEILL